MDLDTENKEFQETLKGIFETTVSATKSTHIIAKLLNDDKFLCSKDADNIEKTIELQANKIWNLLRSSISLCSPNLTIRKKDDVGGKMKVLTEINDIILEIIHKDIDIAKGIDIKPDLGKAGGNAHKAKKSMFWNKGYGNQQRPASEEGSVSVVASPTLVTATVQAKDSGAQYTLVASTDVSRPQLKYNLKIDNSKTPFVPHKLVNKAHALPKQPPVPEDSSSQKDEPAQSRPDVNRAFINPYHEELEQLQPLPSLFTKTVDPKIPAEPEDTPLILVSTEEHMDHLIEDLSVQDVIAVDLEHHSYRSYLGLVCLMQISTRHKDYLLDTFALWDHMNKLIEIFANPKIIKVFHGASKDIEWLQRDFSLYVVNLFDTFFASEALNLPYKSLAYLLNLYCNFKANKEFQLADWRIRPLPDALIKYARCDTHFLIYIYERMKNDILERQATSQPDPTLYPDGLINYVFNKSRRLCQKVYFKPVFGKEFFDTLLKKQNKRFNGKQMYALQNLNEWRDSVARLEDESPFYVLPNHAMVCLSEILPKDFVSLLNCCNPIPPLIKQYVHDVHAVIVRALRQEVKDESGHTSSYGGPGSGSTNACQIAYDNPLHCPHDNQAPKGTRDPEFELHDGQEGSMTSHQVSTQSAMLYSMPPIRNAASLNVGFYKNHQHSNLFFFSRPLTLEQETSDTSTSQPDRAHPTNYYFKSPFEIYVESETLRSALKARKAKDAARIVSKVADQSPSPPRALKRGDDLLLTNAPSTSAQHIEPELPTQKQPPPRIADKISLSNDGKQYNKAKRVRPFDRLARGMVRPIDSYSPPVNSDPKIKNAVPNVEPFDYSSLSYTTMLKGQPKNNQSHKNHWEKGSKNRNSDGMAPKAKKNNPLLSGLKSNRTKSMTFSYDPKPQNKGPPRR